MTGNLKANLAEEAVGCSHFQWWQESLLGGRQAFPLPGMTKHYAPDMPLKVHHFKLAVSVDPVQRTLAGVCTTSFSPILTPVTELFFQAQGLEIEKVSLAGRSAALPFEMSDDGFTVQLPRQLKAGRKMTLNITYRTVSPKAGIYFTGPDENYPNKPVQAWSQGQDEDSHFWYPVLAADYPNHKMTSEVIATCPDSFIALSNGELVAESEDAQNNTKTFHWVHTKPHVNYLVALIVGHFIKLEEHYGDLPVQLYCDPSLEAQARRYFKGTADLVALFSRLYGVEYPWAGKYGQVMVTDFMFGGMENTTITVMTDRILADEQASEEYRKSEITLNAHELNHHWWGDCVTCNNWAHASMTNEGRATYGEVEALEYLYGVKERDAYIFTLAEQYFEEDKKYRRPLVTPYYKDPIDLFDRTLYQKGGLILHMIRYLLGDEGYYKASNTFLVDNLYQCVDTYDWIKAIEKATGRNLRQFFDQWVFGAGFPEYKVTYSWDEQNKLASVKVSQEQQLDETTGLFSMPIEFDFGFADGNKRSFCLEVSEQESSFYFNLDQKPAMFVFDPTNWILKTLDLSGIPRSMLGYQLEHADTVAGRVYAARALAQLGGDDAVKALKRSAPTGFHWSVSAEVARLLGTIGGASARDALKSLVSHENPFVRRAAIAALGEFKDESVAEILAGIVSGTEEESYFVRAEAATALGKTKSETAFAVLAAAMNTPSWNEVVRVGVLSGLAELGDERAVSIAADYAAAGKPWASRPAAITALGKLAEKNAALAIEALHALAEDEETEQFTLRVSVIGALGQAKNKLSRPVLHRMTASAYDGRLKRAILQAQHTISLEKGNSTQEVESLKTQLAELTGQVKHLTGHLWSR